ncbi:MULTISPECIES: hypothetical protein [unclassified Roseateles]|uniref:hypothetical protein n=1 Tax=unclassified Roseateles TaxID=2626991 RepID=UPI0006FEDD66|nr:MULTISPECIES: hypothetical protein [unclassified Roseateles]KQW46208.1 hypothetical protein ASC81_07260 [Pelomonas sp. Root405]KRA73257.1 hypothetical protein ASD88_07260 [Pelomonas sp. Root662]
MRRFTAFPLSLLLCVGTAALAADTTPQSAGTGGNKVIKAPPAASATNTGSAGTGAVPKAGGSGGGVGSNKGTSGQQIGPKKPPKCPDPNETVCPVVAAPVK